MDGQTATLGLVILIIVAALAFDFTNGFHDAANSIATVVATRVLSPGVAVIWAGFFNFVAVVVFGTAVAKTVGGDMVNIALIPIDDRLYVLLAGVLGGNFLEPNHLVFWTAYIQLARAGSARTQAQRSRRSSFTLDLTIYRPF